MKFALDNPTETKKAFAHLTLLASRKASVDIKRLSPRRSMAQNRYLHVIITAFGNFFGYTPEEAKMIYKYINSKMYCYKRNGLTFWRSSAALTKDEMTESIERFRAASARQGYELPTSEQQDWLRQLENDAENTHSPTL